jgi:hypothetical protein
MEKSGFWNSSGGDRLYNAADFAAYFGGLVSNGIFDAQSGNLQVTPHTGMTVSVAAGSAWTHGYRYENTEPLTLPVATANGTHPRVDRVVLRLSMLERSITLAVLTGTAASSPSAPVLTRNSDVYELGIADISIGAAVLSIAAWDITDTRLDTALCGTVNSLVEAVYE